MKNEEKTQVAIWLRRDENGELYSELIDENSWNAVVIDRAKWRRLGSDGVRCRAEALAKILDIPLQENLEWPCKAIRATETCMCPACKKTRYVEATKKLND